MFSNDKLLLIIVYAVIKKCVSQVNQVLGISFTIIIIEETRQHKPFS